MKKNEDKQKHQPKMHYLVYKVTNIQNGMIYVGKHQTTDIYDVYLGSGTYLRKAIAKYGTSSFKKEILFDFNSEKEMLDKEREIVNEDFVKRRDTYNCVIGGQGVFTKQHGNRGTNNKFKELNALPKIWICNPYTMQRKHLFLIKEIPQEYADAGWEYGNLSKYNLTWIDIDGQKISVAKFAQVYKLDKHLVFNRLEAGWSIDEIRSIPESLRLFKTQEQFDTYKKDQLEKRRQARNDSNNPSYIRRQQQRQQKIFIKNEQARLWYNEYVQVGIDQFKANHPDINIKIVQGYFRDYIPEYVPRKRSAKKRLVEYKGKTQTLTAWCNEFNIDRWQVWRMLKNSNMTEQEVLEEILKRKNSKASK